MPASYRDELNFIHYNSLFKPENKKQFSAQNFPSLLTKQKVLENRTL